MVDIKSIESDAVRPIVRGRWLAILAELAPELDRALARPGRHVPCPVHGGRDGFRLFKDAAVSGGGICNSCGGYPDGFALLGWLKGWTFPEALAAVAGVLGIAGLGALEAACRLPARPVAAEDPRKREWARRHRQQTWRESLPLSHPDAAPARRYFAFRGLNPAITEGLSALRFHPNLPYWSDGKMRGHWPALLAAVVSLAGEALTVHRTYLSRSGRKAPVPEPKRLMADPDNRLRAGGVVPLGRPGPLLGVAEGIETALAVRQVTGLPVWPALTCVLLEKFVPPPCVRAVFIWADRDRSEAGEQSACALKARLTARGVKAILLLPPGPIPAGRKSVDWLDVLNTRGPAGFPLLRARHLAA